MVACRHDLEQATDVDRLAPRGIARPLCPFVLWLIAIQPRHAHEVALALRCVTPGTEADRYSAAHATLGRLRDGGLVRRRAAAAGPLYQITRHGRAELGLQRLLWARLHAAGESFV